MTEATDSHLRKELALFLAYFALYMIYMFIWPEGEVLHWLSLVAIPFALLCLSRVRAGFEKPVRDALASVGLRRGNLKSGLAWAIPIGLALSVLQLFLSQRRGEIWELISSGRAFIMFPLILLLMLLMAGFTEEFFFRGVLQTRLAKWLRSNLAAILVVSVLFGVYHIPYAYLMPSWPSHGDLMAAVTSAMVQGVMGGVVLGLVYWRSGGNLVASILVHSLINTLPAMTMIQITFGG